VRTLLGASLLLTAVVGCGTGPDAPTTASHMKMPEKSASAAVEKRTIVIDNFTFDPPEATVPVGAEVTWINHDDVPHTATSTAKPKVFDSGALDTDQKYSRVFTAAGEYEYFCAVHPHMTGRVIVK
jgi:plastocyanin